MERKDVQYAVNMTGITKIFGNFRALDGVDLKVRKGSIHALLGENGAGKSTLMNILYGFYGKDAGEIKINGSIEQINNPKDAIRLGIGMVHQHFMLVENFTIAENIVLGQEITKSGGIMDREEMHRVVTELSARYGLEVDPQALIQDVSVAVQQRVEILKALYRGVDILILDEPTAVLVPQEIDSLIETMHRLVDDGKTVIIITHKLDEIKKAAEYCTIIRRGKLIDTVRVADVTANDLANMMVGKEVSLETDKGPCQVGDPVLEIRDLSVNDYRGVEKVKGLSLTVRSGEIVGIAGVDGNGQTELVSALMGLIKVEKGSIKMQGKEITGLKTREVLDSGVRTIPADRQKDGLVLDFSVQENMIIDNLDLEQFGKGDRIDWQAVRSNATNLIERFDIRPVGSEDLRAGALSGGNQQKIILAREINQNPDLLVAVQPTRGLDVGAISYVREALVEQRDRGCAVLLISFELEEILDISDRINVIYDGKIVGDLDPEKTDEKEIGLLMAGGERVETT